MSFIVYEQKSTIHFGRIDHSLWPRLVQLGGLMSILCCSLNLQLPMPFLLLSSPNKHSCFYSVLLLQKSRCLNWWRALISLRHVTMMRLVIRVLRFALRVFMFILLTLLTFLFHSVNTRADGSLQMLFLCLKMTTSTQRELPSCLSPAKFFQDLWKSCFLSFVLHF